MKLLDAFGPYTVEFTILQQGLRHNLEHWLIVEGEHSEAVRKLVGAYLAGGTKLDRFELENGVWRSSWERLYKNTAIANQVPYKFPFPTLIYSLLNAPIHELKQSIQAHWKSKDQRTDTKHRRVIKERVQL